MRESYNRRGDYLRRRDYLRRKKLILMIPFVIALIVFLLLEIKFSFNDHQYTIYVTDKTVKTDSHSTDDGTKVTSKYLIYGQDAEENYYVFENTDNLLRLKVDSSTIYAKIKTGKTYKFTVVGYRVPFLSWYENIIEVVEIPE